MALQIDVTPEELALFKALNSGGLSWEQLQPDQKMTVYMSNVDMEGIVPREKLIQYENELAKEGHFGVREMVKEQVKDATREITQ